MIIIFHFVNNYVWLRVDKDFTGADVIKQSYTHLLTYNALSDILMKNRNFGKSVIEILKLFNIFSEPFNNSDCWNRPRLVYLISATINFISGNLDIITTRLYTNIIYLIVLVFSVYLIGKEVLNEKCGLLAAFIVSFYPAIWGISRKYGLDFPLIAMAALCMYLLIRTKYFTNLKFSVLLGICGGLGVLTRGHLLFIIAGPVLYYFYQSYLQKDIERVKMFFNIVAFLSSMILISSLWWSGGVKTLVNFFMGHLMVHWPGFKSSLEFIPPCQDLTLPQIFSLGWLAYYLKETLINITPISFIIFAVFLGFFLKLRKIKHKELMLAWIIAPYIILTIISTKSDRYYFPSFPAFALITAAGITRIHSSSWRKLTIFSVILISLFQFFKFSYGIKYFPDFTFGMTAKYRPWTYHPPMLNNYTEVFEKFVTLMKDKTPPHGKLRIGVIEKEGKWNAQEMSTVIEYFLQLHRIDADIKFSLEDKEGFFSALEGYDFLITVNEPDSVEPGIESGLSTEDFFKKYKLIDTEVLKPINLAVCLYRSSLIDL